MRKCLLPLLLMTALSLVSPVHALEPVFSEQLVAETGAPTTHHLSLDGYGVETLVLRLHNGEPDGTRRVSSAVVSLNGVRILGPADFNQKVAIVERTIVAQDGENSLAVTLRSNPGGLLRIEVLVDPLLNLPPDPGGAGRATIAGIDTNGDGVRDDVERWIAITYPESEKTRMALTQMYHSMQNMMLHADLGDEDAVYDDMTAMSRASECFHYIRPEDAYRLVRELRAQVVNTRQRVHAYRDASRMLGGGSFPSKPFSKWNLSCTFDVDALEN